MGYLLTRSLPALALGLGLCLGAAIPVKAATADAVFRGGGVYTVNAARAWAEAVAVRQGRIVFVGSDREASRWIGKRTVLIDLHGKMLLPGFQDSHVHPISSGVGLGECVVDVCTNELQIVEAVAAYAKAHPNLTWIRGGGWALPIFPGANPHKSLLDRVVSDRPVYLVGADGHSAWVNSRALAIAGITKDTVDPLPGRIERDPSTGEPTGTLREDAVELVARHLPPYTAKDYLEGLHRAQEMANRFGITSLVEADATEDLLRAYAEFDHGRRLTVRVTAAMHIDPAKGTHQIAGLKRWRNEYRGRLLRATSAKIYADGVIEAHTAALLEPYVGRGDDRGKANVEPEALNPLVAALDREGFQVHVHAIGDRAIRTTLDAFAYARERNGARDSRHQVAHVELWSPADIPRFRALGVIANFQPLWAFADPYIEQLTVPVLGPERSRWLYPIRSVVQTGAILACGSDWSVSSMNPLEAIQVALTRRALEAGPGAAWIPEETVDLATMLAGYTINGAYASFSESKTGSIEVGKVADLAVVDRNLFELKPHEIRNAKVVLTMLNGRVVYRDGPW